MKILLLTQVLPYPPSSGPKFKTWNVLKYLSQHHHVVLASFVRGEVAEQVEAIEKLGVEVHTVPIARGRIRDLWYAFWSVMTGQPFMIVRDARRGMRALVQKLALEHQFDLVQVDQLNMAQYAPAMPGTKRVLDAHNSLWVLYKRLAEVTRFGPTRWLLSRDWRLLKKYEGRICRDFDYVIAVSQNDRAALVEAAGQDVDIRVIPITVDMDELGFISRSEKSSHILHMGTMYWPPNAEGVMWFLKEVWPLIRRKNPGVIFDIVGARPPQEIAELGRADDRVQVLGFVEDPRPFLEAARVMIVPLRAGSGMRVKILDGLARGIPIVTTSLGVEGIEAQSGRHLVVADTPQAFAEGVLQLLTDSDKADTYARNGRELVARQYDYRRVLRDLEPVYSEVSSHRVTQDEPVLPMAGTP